MLSSSPECVISTRLGLLASNARVHTHICMHTHASTYTQMHYTCMHTHPTHMCAHTARSCLDLKVAMGFAQRYKNSPVIIWHSVMR